MPRQGAFELSAQMLVHIIVAVVFLVLFIAIILKVKG